MTNLLLFFLFFAISISISIFLTRKLGKQEVAQKHLKLAPHELSYSVIAFTFGYFTKDSGAYALGCAFLASAVFDFVVGYFKWTPWIKEEGNQVSA